MLLRCLICVFCLSLSAPAASVDPVLLFLLRMVRDQIIATSIERGITALRQPPAPSAPTFGYALATPPVSSGSEEQRLRTLIDESFLHLTASQRDTVFVGVQKILNDPQHAKSKPLIVAEFTVKANTVRESYRRLDRLTNSEKRALAAQAKEEFSRLPPGERQQMLEMLQSGMLPVPRDLTNFMLSELSAFSPATVEQRRPD